MEERDSLHLLIEYYDKKDPRIRDLLEEEILSPKFFRFLVGHLNEIERTGLEARKVNELYVKMNRIFFMCEKSRGVWVSFIFDNLCGFGISVLRKLLNELQLSTYEFAQKNNFSAEVDEFLRGVIRGEMLKVKRLKANERKKLKREFQGKFGRRWEKARGQDERRERFKKTYDMSSLVEKEKVVVDFFIFLLSIALEYSPQNSKDFLLRYTKIVKMDHNFMTYMELFNQVNLNGGESANNRYNAETAMEEEGETDEQARQTEPLEYLFRGMILERVRAFVAKNAPGGRGGALFRPDGNQFVGLGGVLLNLCKTYEAMEYVRVMRDFYERIGSRALRLNFVYLVEVKLKYSEGLTNLVLNHIRLEYKVGVLKGAGLKKYFSQEINALMEDCPFVTYSFNEHFWNVLLLLICLKNSMFQQYTIIEVFNKMVMWFIKFENVMGGPEEERQGEETQQQTFVQKLFGRICQMESVYEVVLEVCFEYWLKDHGSGNVKLIKMMRTFTREVLVLNVFRNFPPSRHTIFRNIFLRIFQERKEKERETLVKFLKQVVKSNAGAVYPPHTIDLFKDKFLKVLAVQIPLPFFRKITKVFYCVMRFSPAFKSFFFVEIKKMILNTDVERRRKAIVLLIALLKFYFVYDKQKAKEMDGFQENDMAEVAKCFKIVLTKYSQQLRKFLYLRLTPIVKKYGMARKGKEKASFVMYKQLYKMVEGRVRRYFPKGKVERKVADVYFLKVDNKESVQYTKKEAVTNLLNLYFSFFGVGNTVGSVYGNLLMQMKDLSTVVRLAFPAGDVKKKRGGAGMIPLEVEFVMGMLEVVVANFFVFFGDENDEERERWLKCLNYYAMLNKFLAWAHKREKESTFIGRKELMEAVGDIRKKYEMLEGKELGDKAKNQVEDLPIYVVEQVMAILLKEVAKEKRFFENGEERNSIFGECLGIYNSISLLEKRYSKKKKVSEDMLEIKDILSGVAVSVAVNKKTKSKHSLFFQRALTMLKVIDGLKKEILSLLLLLLEREGMYETPVDRDLLRGFFAKQKIMGRGTGDKKLSFLFAEFFGRVMEEGNLASPELKVHISLIEFFSSGEEEEETCEIMYTILCKNEVKQVFVVKMFLIYVLAHCKVQRSLRYVGMVIKSLMKWREREKMEDENGEGEEEGEEDEMVMKIHSQSMFEKVVDVVIEYFKDTLRGKLDLVDIVTCTVVVKCVKKLFKATKEIKKEAIIKKMENLLAKICSICVSFFVKNFSFEKHFVSLKKIFLLCKYVLSKKGVNFTSEKYVSTNRYQRLLQNCHQLVKKMKQVHKNKDKTKLKKLLDSGLFPLENGQQEGDFDRKRQRKSEKCEEDNETVLADLRKKRRKVSRRRSKNTYVDQLLAEGKGINGNDHYEDLDDWIVTEGEENERVEGREKEKLL